MPHCNALTSRFTPNHAVPHYAGVTRVVSWATEQSILPKSKLLQKAEKGAEYDASAFWENFLAKSHSKDSSRHQYCAQVLPPRFVCLYQEEVKFCVEKSPRQTAYTVAVCVRLASVYVKNDCVYWLLFNVGLGGATLTFTSVSTRAHARTHIHHYRYSLRHLMLPRSGF